MTKVITKNYKQTQKLGQNLAKEILNCKKNISKNKATVLCLYGDLGGGKTTFMQGFAKGMGIKQKVLSPTFVIMKHYQPTPQPPPEGKGKKRKREVLPFGKDLGWVGFFHIDAYRLQNHKDAVELELKEIFKNPKNIIAIEWPERIKKILPKNAIKINFKFISENQRSIDIFQRLV